MEILWWQSIDCLDYEDSKIHWGFSQWSFFVQKWCLCIYSSMMKVLSSPRASTVNWSHIQKQNFVCITGLLDQLLSSESVLFTIMLNVCIGNTCCATRVYSCCFTNIYGLWMSTASWSQCQQKCRLFLKLIISVLAKASPLIYTRKSKCWFIEIGVSLGYFEFSNTMSLLVALSNFIYY